MLPAGYTTNDPYLASFLLSEGSRLIGYRRLGRRRVEFRFAADRTLHELVRLYHSRRLLQISPARLFESLKELKRRPVRLPAREPPDAASGPAAE